jgi:phosphohistidine swiveling domain-containing protein
VGKGRTPLLRIQGVAAERIKEEKEREKMRYEASPFEFDEELDCAVHPAWFIDGLHVPETADYVGGSWVADVVTHGMCWAAEQLSLPNCKGILWRDYKQLRFIITPKVVESEAEVREREVKFRENINRLVRDFGPMWEEYKKELLELYRPFKELDLKKASNLELAKKVEDLRQVGFRMCEIHFWGLYSSWVFFVMFREFCAGLGIDTSSQEYNAMLRGFDNKSFQCERELWRLSRRVLELNLGSVFELPAQEVAPKLQEEVKGQEWLRELDAFLDEYGWRVVNCWYPSTPSWVEDPRYVIQKVQEYLKLTDRTPISEKAAEEREPAIANMISRVPADKREMFNLLLKGAQYADSFSEEHDLYCEMQTDALRRVYLQELGKRFVEAGTINEVSDIYWLWLDETRKTAFWPEKWRMQSVIEERKAKAKKDQEKEIPPVISKNLNMQEALAYLEKSRDPILIYTLVGEMPKPKPELKADITGVPGAPGVAEGPARVILSEQQLGDVRPGEILVCPTTSISWTTTFSLVKGVVVDRGGILSHAAVVSRQYGLPCVINSFVGTSQIKTGQRLRVDGTEGVVYILDKPAADETHQ